MTHSYVGVSVCDIFGTQFIEWPSFFENADLSKIPLVIYSGSVCDAPHKIS